MGSFNAFCIAHGVTNISVVTGTELLPDVRFEASSVPIDLFFHRDVGNIEDDAKEVFVEGSDVFDLFPLGELIASSFLLVEWLESL